MALPTFAQKGRLIGFIKGSVGAAAAPLPRFTWPLPFASASGVVGPGEANSTFAFVGGS